MQSLARFSLKSLVCHTIHDLIRNLTKVVHSHRQMFIISSSLFKKRKKKVLPSKGHHLHLFNRADRWGKIFLQEFVSF